MLIVEEAVHELLQPKTLVPYFVFLVLYSSSSPRQPSHRAQPEARLHTTAFNHLVSSS
jgi:hypothetical protein